MLNDTSSKESVWLGLTGGDIEIGGFIYSEASASNVTCAPDSRTSRKSAIGEEVRAGSATGMFDGSGRDSDMLALSEVPPWDFLGGPDCASSLKP